VYAPAAIPVVSMLTLTVPFTSGPVTTGACTVEWCPVPVTRSAPLSWVASARMPAKVGDASYILIVW
jgi:hypothetical protein